MKAVRLYAQVLTDVVLAPHSGFQMSSVVQELTQFSKMMTEGTLFLQVFDNPALGDDDKQKVLKEFVSKLGVSKLAERFLSLLAKRNRLGLLPQILSELEVLEIEKKGGLIGELTSAAPLDSGTVAGVQEALSRRLNRPVQLKQKVDQSIIAGLRVTVSGVTYDGSVKGKLEKLANSL